MTNTPNEKVRQLQRRLWVCAKSSKTRRFHALYDRIYRSDVLKAIGHRDIHGAGAMRAEDSVSGNEYVQCGVVVVSNGGDTAYGTGPVAIDININVAQASRGDGALPKGV